MRIFTVIGLVTTMIAMSTAETATGDKYWFCIAAGWAGIILIGLSNLLSNDEDKY